MMNPPYLIDAQRPPSAHFDGTDVCWRYPGDKPDDFLIGSFDVADATATGLASQCVDLVFGSPPYLEARTYGIQAEREMQSWIHELMLPCTREALRVSRGLVLWVIAGTTEQGMYQPGPEGLMYEAWKAGIQMYRPCCWYKVDPLTGGGSGTPGSGGKQWLRGDWEYVIAFKNPGPLPWADPLFQQRAPKYPPGGNMRNRQPSGRREDNKYKNPRYANPGNVVKARVGGGHIGDKEAHEGEAPFPEKLAEFFIRGFCPPFGWVHDPFSGSGTTVCEAVRWCRNGYGTDLRPSQVALGTRRLIRRIKEGRELSLCPWPLQGGGDVRPDAQVPN